MKVGIYNFSCPSQRLYSAMLMIKSWIREGEVSGTDHCIGMEYDEEEYKNQIMEEMKEKFREEQEDEIR